MHVAQHLAIGHPELVALVIAHVHACLLGAQRSHRSGDAELILDIRLDPYPFALIFVDGVIIKYTLFSFVLSLFNLVANMCIDRLLFRSLMNRTDKILYVYI